MDKLVLKNISMIYQTIETETKAVEDISFNIKDGEFVVIVGPSGCGKSTILSIIAGLINPSYGEIYLDGEKISYPCNKIGYMFQKDTLFEWRTIFKNITLGLEIRKELTKENLNYANILIEKYGLASFKNYYPRQLSGGMRQRVALIRTLVLNPEILLLDEPFSALDYHTRLLVADEIYKIIKAEGKTAVMVTHDIAEAISLADRVIVLSSRPARIKTIIDIKLSVNNKTPLLSRNAPEFKDYFNLIWKELDKNEY
ncbi:ABC transporter ATP-binding protein [Thermobrachium celere]|uniref:Hydroxymethylpyrimidine ABC transporter, ATPase component n=1 Tax=Thermobrachium celere DSM 8682 TaxID=941824 RepID=R7RT30_9CLOT|nr:ABC transporter ATP-binding protein [Thermobrachium celere]CDF58511.1 Hydroxymethylpyrimidine ABC transporter, ATPase component [Thermobrachium celere DSM 8682]